MLDLWWKHTTPDDVSWCQQRAHWLDTLPSYWDKRFSQLWRRLLLSRYLGCAPSEVAFQIGEQGKPALIGSDLHFSVSHSHHWHLLLVSNAPCGVDIEPWDRPLEKMLRPVVLNRFAEAEQLKQASPADFLRCWTMKEAWAKSRGCSVWNVINTPLEAVASPTSDSIQAYAVPAMASGYVSRQQADQLARHACVAWAADAADVGPQIRKSDVNQD